MATIWSQFFSMCQECNTNFPENMLRSCIFHHPFLGLNNFDHPYLQPLNVRSWHGTSSDVLRSAGTKTEPRWWIGSISASLAGWFWLMAMIKWSIYIYIYTSVFVWVCLKIVYPYTQWLMIIIPTKWLFHWGVYPIFRHTHIVVFMLIPHLPGEGY